MVIIYNLRSDGSFCVPDELEMFDYEPYDAIDFVYEMHLKEYFDNDEYDIDTSHTINKGAFISIDKNEEVNFILCESHYIFNYLTRYRDGSTYIMKTDYSSGNGYPSSTYVRNAGNIVSNLMDIKGKNRIEIQRNMHELVNFIMSYIDTVIELDGKPNR